MPISDFFRRLTSRRQDASRDGMDTYLDRVQPYRPAAVSYAPDLESGMPAFTAMRVSGSPTQAGLEGYARGAGNSGSVGGAGSRPGRHGSSPVPRPDFAYARKIIYEVSSFGLITSLILATLGDIATKLSPCFMQTVMLFLGGLFFMISPTFGRYKKVHYFATPMPKVGLIYLIFSITSFSLNAIPLAWGYDTNFDLINDNRSKNICIDGEVVTLDFLKRSRILDIFSSVFCLAMIAIPLITITLIKTIHSWQEKRKQEETLEELRKVQDELLQLRAVNLQLGAEPQPAPVEPVATSEVGAWRRVDEGRISSQAEEARDGDSAQRTLLRPSTSEWRRIGPFSQEADIPQPPPPPLIDWQDKEPKTKESLASQAPLTGSASSASLPPPPLLKEIKEEDKKKQDKPVARAASPNAP